MFLFRVGSSGIGDFGFDLASGHVKVSVCLLGDDGTMKAAPAYAVDLDKIRIRPITSELISRAIET